MRGRILVGTVLIGVLVAATVSGSQAATKPERGYITSALTLPASPSEANGYGRDVDGDGTPDNQFGQVLTTLASQGLDLTAVMDGALTSGDIVMLHSLRTFSLANTKNATWQVWYGAPTVDPDMSGGGTFELPAGQPHSEKLAATIKNHVVKTVAGKIPVRLDLGGGPFLLKMTKAKVVATCELAGCTNGKIAGAVSSAQLDAKLIPNLANWFTEAVAAECQIAEGVVVCDSGSTGNTVNNLFNTNQDLVITADEIRDSSLIQSLLAPDLDLVTGDGGANDALSFGFGFSTVKAKLTRP